MLAYIPYMDPMGLEYPTMPNLNCGVIHGIIGGTTNCKQPMPGAQPKTGGSPSAPW